MTPTLFSEYLSSLTLNERARFLIRIASELTIYAREYGATSAGAENSSSRLKKLTGFNELQHKILGQASLYLDGEREKVYPVDVFTQIVFQAAEYYEIAPDLATAIQYVQQKTSTKTPGGNV